MSITLPRRRPIFPCETPGSSLTIWIVQAQSEKGAGLGRDAAVEIEGLMGRVDAGSIGRVERALERRRRELAKLGVAGEAGNASRVLEYRSHEDGTLQAEVRVRRRKDGSEREHGPYWYFKHQEGGRRRSVYLGRTDDPEGALKAKREGGGSRP